MDNILVEDLSIQYKQCPFCKRDFPMTREFFHKNKRAKDGLVVYCKECANYKSNEWKKNNPEKNKEVYTSMNAKPEIRERVNRYVKKRSQEGKYREWQRNNPEKVKASNQYRVMNKTHEITTNEWENCKKYFNHRCAYCQIKIEDHYINFKGEIILGDFHKEHVRHKGDNDLSNCVPSCKSCNSSKHNIDLEDWYKSRDDIYTKDRILKIYQWMETDYHRYIEIK